MKIKYAQITLELFQNHPILKNHMNLLECIKNKFTDDDVLVFIKVPGRVNLIGEHVDYNNGPVLPCAIDREVIFCLSFNSQRLIRVLNVNPAYKDIEFSARDQIETYEKGHWGNYIKAGVKGIQNYILQSSKKDMDQIFGFSAIVSSTVPQAAGLSSSSTLVVGAALAMVKANKLQLSKMQIAEICADAEHFVGTAGGGMDHAAILLGENKSFLKIKFNPLNTEPISAPHDLELVLFHSLIKAEKGSYVRNAYNRRVLECNLSMDLFNLYITDRKINLKNRLSYIGDISTKQLGLDRQQLDELITEFLNSLSQMYSLEQLLTLFEVSKKDLSDRYQHVLKGASLDTGRERFNLKKRFKHVYSECQRVNQAVESLKSNNKTELGRLLDGSHKSLSEDYEVSTPEVDSIVRLLKLNGAYGARMVGAGFGGMILALTDKASADELVDKMQKSFYTDKSIKEYPEYIIRCNPADGAGFIQIC